MFLLNYAGGKIFLDDRGFIFNPDKIGMGEVDDDGKYLE